MPKTTVATSKAAREALDHNDLGSGELDFAYDGDRAVVLAGKYLSGEHLARVVIALAGGRTKEQRLAWIDHARQLLSELPADE